MTNGTTAVLTEAIPIAVAGVVLTKTAEQLEPKKAKKKKKGEREFTPLSLF